MNVIPLPRKHPARVRLLHLTDLHFTPAGIDDTGGGVFRDHFFAELTRVLTEEKGDVDLVAVTGDIVDRAEFSEADLAVVLRRSLRFLLEVCAQCKVDPALGLLVVAGNHDCKWKGIANVESGRKLFDLVYRSYADHRLYPDLELLVGCFDSNVTSTWGELATGRVDIADVAAWGADLATIERKPAHPHAALLSGCYRLALVHHHPLPVSEAEFPDPQDRVEKLINKKVVGAAEFMLLRNSGTFLEALFRERINLILHGHLHRRNYWRLTRKVDGQQHDMEVISGGSFVTENHRREFNIVDLDTRRGLARCRAISFNDQGHPVGTYCFPTARYRERRESLWSRRRHGAEFVCDRHYKNWEVSLPLGDTVTTEILENLRPADGKARNELHLKAHSTSMTQQTFHATAAANSPVGVTFASSDVPPAGEQPLSPDGKTIYYTVRFSQAITEDRPVTLILQRRTLGSMFNNRRSRQMWGTRRSEQNTDLCTQLVRFQTRHLAQSIRFVGDQAPPTTLNVVARGPGDQADDQETKFANETFLHWPGGGLPVEFDAGKLYQPPGEFAVDLPLRGWNYSFEFATGEEEYDDPSIRDRLRTYRKHLLALPTPAAAGGPAAAAAQRFLQQVLASMRDAVRQFDPDGFHTDEKLFAWLFTVDDSTIDDSEAAPKGALMRLIAAEPELGPMRGVEIYWGRDIIGRAARRGVFTWLNRPYVDRTRDVFYALPKSIQYMLAYPLYCHKADQIPTAVVAIASEEDTSGLASLCREPQADDKLGIDIWSWWERLWRPIMGRSNPLRAGSPPAP